MGVGGPPCKLRFKASQRHWLPLLRSPHPSMPGTLSSLSWGQRRAHGEQWGPAVQTPSLSSLVFLAGKARTSSEQWWLLSLCEILDHCVATKSVASVEHLG